MSETAPARPRQVTLAAWTIMLGSAFVVLLTFEMFSNLHTLQTRESVETFLSEPPGDGLGMSVDSALVVLRTFGMVAAGCATAAGILGYHVLQRNRLARVALTVLAVPLLVSGMATGGFLSSLVAASAFLLWLPPARDWFAGRDQTKPTHPALAPPPHRLQQPPEHREPWPQPGPSAPPPSPADAGRPRAMTGFGASPPAHPVAPGTSRQPTAFWAPASSRPSAVVWASALTWLFSGLGAVLMAVGLAYFAGNSEPMLAEVRAQNPEIAEAGLTDDAIVAATVVMGALVVAWALAAMVLGFLFYRGVSWSRLVLLISTGGAVGLLALAAFAQWPLIVPFLAAATTFSLLLRPESAAWVKRR